VSTPEHRSSPRGVMWLRGGAQVIGGLLVLLGVMGWVDGSRFVGGAWDGMGRGSAGRFALALTAAGLAVCGLTASVGGCLIAAGLRRGLVRSLVKWVSGASLLLYLCMLYFALTMQF
jgi:hypothetical protein